MSPVEQFKDKYIANIIKCAPGALVVVKYTTYSHSFHDFDFGNSVEPVPDFGLPLSLHIQCFIHYSLSKHSTYLLSVLSSRI